jgi:hypothetical protein
MTLKKWLKKNDVSYLQFARKIGTTKQLVFFLCTRPTQKNIRLETALKVELATKGEVSYKDLLTKEDIKFIKEDMKVAKC